MDTAFTFLPESASLECVAGRANVLRGLLALQSLVAGTAQQYELADVQYFLDRPHRIPMKPHLVLVYAGSRKTPLGGVLLLEFQGIYLSCDRHGRSSVFGPEELRVDLAALAARFLFQAGARLVNIDANLGEVGKDGSARAYPFDHALALAELRLASSNEKALSWSLDRSVVCSHMPLTADFDSTLAPLGRKARKNLRRYRRLALRELGCRYKPDARLSKADFLELAAHSHYPSDRRAVLWRYRSLTRFGNTFLCGLQTRDGQWLSVAGCRRNGREVEIDWQMNRRGFESYSLSTALRSSLILNEVSRGTSRLAVEGGDLHQLGSYFPGNAVYHLAVQQPASLMLRCFSFVLSRWLPLHFLTTAVARPRRK